MSKMIIGERIELTKGEYKRMVCSRLKEGETYKVQTEERENMELFGRKRKIKVIKKLKVEKFYPNFVLFVDKRGLAMCLSYPDAYMAIYGREDDDQEMDY